MKFYNNKYLYIKAIKSIILILFLLISNVSCARDEDLTYYLGLYGGASLPLKHHFMISYKDKNTDQIQNIKTDIAKSYMFSVSVGHKISEGSSLEFSFDWKPQYPMSINLGGQTLDTNALAYIGMIDFIYDLANIANIKPYFLVGTGVANVRITEQSIENTFTLNKNNKFALAFQFGLGARYKINNQISFDLATRLQGISNVAIKYQTTNTSTGALDTHTTKQHLAVVELMLGFIFDF